MLKSIGLKTTFFYRLFPKHYLREIR